MNSPNLSSHLWPPDTSWPQIWIVSKGFGKFKEKKESILAMNYNHSADSELN